MRYLILALRNPQFQPSVIDAHKEYLAKLRAQGVLELAGPFTDKTGGAYMVKADDLESAKAMAQKDPVHLTGASTVSVHEWDAV